MHIDVDATLRDSTLRRVRWHGAAARLGHALVALLVFSGAFVLFEPAPYDIFSLLVMSVLFLLGLPIARGVAPLFGLLLVFTGFGFVAATNAAMPNDALFYVLVTGFLAATSVFYACYVAADPAVNLPRIATAYIAAASCAATLAILGYFGLIPGAEMLTRFGRASGPFQDPNVLGPFLIPAALLLLNRLFTGHPSRHLLSAGLLLVICFCLLLTFSRGAWGHFLVSAATMTYLAFITAQGIGSRLRIVAFCALGVLALACLLAVALSLEQVSDLFEQRARLTQPYDTAETGRFANQIRGLFLIAEQPLGLGATEFGRIFGEDPHNVYLNAFASYGWLGGVCYLGLVITTLAFGAVHALRRTPWQGLFQAFYAAFVGVALLALVIDTDHWRHFFLLVGVLWGAMIAGRAHFPGSAVAPVALRSAVPITIVRPHRSVAQPG